MAENPTSQNPSSEEQFAPATPQVVNTIIKPARKKATAGISNKKTGTKKRRQTTNVENANSGSWLTIISNLVLLLAIFAIIFSAQRALHNNKNENVLVQQTQPPPQPEATAPLMQETDQPSADATTAVEQAVEKESNKQGAVSGEQSVAIVKEEQPVEVKVKKRPKHDPYTSGGPLDLDRTSGRRDPWNAGGDKDLDSEAVRMEYKKSYLSSSDPDKQAE